MDAHQWWKDEKNTKIPTFGSGRVIEIFVWEKQALRLKTLGAAELHHCPVPQFPLGFRVLVPWENRGVAGKLVGSRLWVWVNKRPFYMLLLYALCSQSSASKSICGGQALRYLFCHP